MGGCESLAREIAVGRLGQKLERPYFWGTVLRFFVAHPEMQLEHVNPIVDFIHANKFAGDEVLTPDGMQPQNPPRPNFSMEGRTLKSILRLVSRGMPTLESQRMLRGAPGGNRAFRVIGFWRKNP